MYSLRYPRQRTPKYSTYFPDRMRCGFRQESHIAPSDIEGGDFILRYHAE